MENLSGCEALLTDVKRENGVTARRLGVHLGRGGGTGQGAHVQALHGLLRRRHRFRRRSRYVDAARAVLVDPHVRLLTLCHNQSTMLVILLALIASETRCISQELLPRIVVHPFKLLGSNGNS